MEQTFKGFPSIPRLSKDMIITEKIDWTNACVVIEENWNIFAQSRSRIITIENDNFWFAKRVQENKDELSKLWTGYHFWEWRWKWIQRRYNEKEKKFSLFYFNWEELPNCVSIVPTLYKWPFDTVKINEIMQDLKTNWSYASEWFMNPEWIVVYHTASKNIFKKTFEADEWKRTSSLSKLQNDQTFK